MCGIAGILSFDGRPAAPDVLERMVRTLGHRGPDAAAILIDGPVGLGHTRLSIIDPEGGHQPMTNADGTLWIAFNGEIFNYVELRDELARRSHRFLTRSDTEVILHLYEEYGEDCVEQLNGQWSFAIWDVRRRRLFLSRDRLGVRPLFYAVAADSFVFGSEIKALFAHGAVERRIDAEALDQLFTFWAPLAPRTMFAGVAELPPGHSLVVAGRDLRPHCDWHPEYGEAAAETDEEAAAERLRELVIDATRLRLRADVPVGAYLSGGLDSTIITAIVKRFTATPLRTFSIAFDAPDLDESRYQEAASRDLGTDHEALRCSAADIGRVFPDVIWHTERPVVRTAPAPMFLLSGLVNSRGCKVVLTGEGSDEVFGGYDIFKETKIRRFIGVFPQSTLRPRLLRRLYPYMANIQAQPEAYLRAFFGGGDAADPLFSHIPRWTLTSQIKRFYSDAFRAGLGAYDPVGELRQRLPARFDAWDSFSRAEYLEIAHLLPAYILSSQGDRMAMGHSVEGRFPFLDHRVVRYAASLPPRLKMKVLDEKHLLKRAFRGLIPEAVRRRRKQPYRAPDAQSFLAPGGGLLGYAEDLLSIDRLRGDGIFDPAAVSLLVLKARRAQMPGTKDNMSLVGILSTQLLIDRFIRNFRHAEDTERRTHVHRRELPLRARVG
jgi:asparagine synthase (glutamine-hydrolysing)